MSLFGNLGSTERKTGTLFGSTAAPPGGLFGNSQNQNQQQQQPSLFGASAANTQQNTNAGGLFGGLGQSQQNTQQQQQQPNMGASVMGGLVRPAPSLHQSQVQQLQQQQQVLPKLRQSTADKFTNMYIDGASMYQRPSQRALLTLCRGEVCS